MLRVIVFLIGISILAGNDAIAQTQNTWKTYTSDECNVSFQYPPNWAKQDTADTNMSFLVSPNDAVQNFSPSFSLQNCLDLDVINKMLNAFPLGFKNISDAKSYSSFAEKTASMLSALVGTVTNQSDVFTVVENTTITPKFISGEDAAVLTAQIKTDVGNASSIDVKSRIYSVIHNGIAYPFMFTENFSRFDLPENMKVREQILDSIRFTN